MIVIDLGVPTTPAGTKYYRLDPARFPDVPAMSAAVTKLTGAYLMPNLKPVICTTVHPCVSFLSLSLYLCSLHLCVRARARVCAILSLPSLSVAVFWYKRMLTHFATFDNDGPVCGSTFDGNVQRCILLWSTGPLG